MSYRQSLSTEVNFYRNLRSTLLLEVHNMLGIDSIFMFPLVPSTTWWCYMSVARPTSSS